MEDWTADLLLQVIQFLSVRDAGRLSLQSRRCSYLVDRYRVLRGPELASAASAGAPPHIGGGGGGDRSPQQRTANEVCRRAVDQLQAPPSLVLAFSSTAGYASSQRQSPALLNPLPRDAVILGSTADSIQTAGIFGECEYGSQFALMMLAGLPTNAVVKPFCLRSADASSDEGLEGFLGGLEESLGWKMIIMYVCGDGAQIADSVIKALQAKFPQLTIVGGICNTAYVTIPLDPASTGMEKLSQCTSHTLRQMNDALGGPALSAGLTKAELAQSVHEVAETKSFSLRTICGQEAQGGICGVALAGDVPVRTVVSRGVQSLTSIHSGGDGTPQPETSFFVHEAAVYHRGDAGFLFSDDGPRRYHLVQKVRDESSGKIFTINQMLNTFGEPHFLGLRRPHHDGFRIEHPHPLSMHLGAFLVVSDSVLDDDETLVGCNVDFFDLNGQECMNDMDFCMSKLREQTAGEELLGAVMISCSGRGPLAGSWITEDMADAKRFAKVFPKVPCLGIYSGGEIGPLALAGRRTVFQEGNASVQGFTAVFALFIVPKFDLGTTRGLDDRTESVSAFVQDKMNRHRGGV